MPKYYRIEMDDFESLPFGSDMDEGDEGHAMVIEEQFKDEFVAEQVSRFTRYLLSILHEVERRGDKYPFDNLSRKYNREVTQYGEWFVLCPSCMHLLLENDWNEETNLINPCCPYCLEELEMEEEEE